MHACYAPASAIHASHAMREDQSSVPTRCAHQESCLAGLIDRSCGHNDVACLSHFKLGICGAMRKHYCKQQRDARAVRWPEKSHCCIVYWCVSMQERCVSTGICTCTRCLLLVEQECPQLCNSARAHEAACTVSKLLVIHIRQLVKSRESRIRIALVPARYSSKHHSRRYLHSQCIVQS